MSNSLFAIICGVSLVILFSMAAILGKLHEPERKKCIEAGYTWSKTEYVCIVKP